MRKTTKRIGLFAALLMSAAMLFGFAAPSLAASEVTVTYKTPFFTDVVKKLESGSAAEEVFFSDVRGKIDSEHTFASSDVSVEWFADEGCTTPYGFDEAVEENLTLYGKVTDTGRYVRANGFGWDVQQGKVYAGDPVQNNYITTGEYVSPSYVDEENGVASLSMNGVKYCVYARGLDVTKSFTVDLDFTNVSADGGVAWFEYSVFPSLTLAQAGGVNTWANAGAASVLMFNLAGGGSPQPFSKGTVVAGQRSSTETSYQDVNAFKALFENRKVSFTAEVTEEGTIFSSGGKTVATSSAKRSDFPSGYAYLSFATNGSASMGVEADVSVSQEGGKITASGDGNAVVGEIAVNGMAVTLPITFKDGYELKSVQVNGADIVAVKLRGSDRYALELPQWGKDAAVTVTSQKIGGESSGGCKSRIGYAPSLLAAGGAASCALLLALSKGRRKSN